jgi:hypothetical protein
MVQPKALGEQTSESVGHRRGQREKILKRKIIKTKVKILADMSRENHVNCI